MSMYTKLLDTAFDRRPQVDAGVSERDALVEVLQCRADMEQGCPSEDDPDRVPVVLAQQIGYDLALVQLARLVGINTDPSRFQPPQRERDRLERALEDLGINLDGAVDGEGAVPGRS